MAPAGKLLPLNPRSVRIALLRWYDRNRRDLPWRETTDPYRIWVSEIMLQQTRVGAVMEHYRAFLERFPTVNALAAVELPQVLAAWSGLGYYRRARSMHAAAQQIVQSHAGQLPDTVEGLRALPGIGRYTSAAIASIAFGVPEAVVDGNVERVLCRLAAVDAAGKNSAWVAAQTLLSPSRPGDWNQAMMELGATICLPGVPRCDQCPVRRWCLRPAANTRRPEPERQRRAVIYSLATQRGSVYLIRRSHRESRMPGMWELPKSSPSDAPVLTRVKHSITNTDFDVAVVAHKPGRHRRGRWFKLSELETIPLTGLARKILRRANLLPHGMNPNLKITRSK